MYSLPCLKPFDGLPLIIESNPRSYTCHFSSPQLGNHLLLQPFPWLWNSSSFVARAGKWQPMGQTWPSWSEQKLRLVFIFLNSCILNGYTSTNIVSWTLPLGPKSLKYVCSGPLQEKFTLSCFTLSWYFLPCNPKRPVVTFCHAFAQAIPATPDCLSSTSTDQLPCAGVWNTNQTSNPPPHPHTQPLTL